MLLGLVTANTYHYFLIIVRTKFAKLVEKIKNNRNILIVKMGGTVDDYDGLKIEGYPSIFSLKE